MQSFTGDFRTHCEWCKILNWQDSGFFRGSSIHTLCVLEEAAEQSQELGVPGSQPRGPKVKYSNDAFVNNNSLYSHGSLFIPYSSEVVIVDLHSATSLSTKNSPCCG